MKILVTGSNGLAGQKLSALLMRDPGVEPILASRGKSVLKVERGEYHSLDITRRDDVMRLIEKVRPDVVINCAAMTLVDHCETHHDECWEINVNGVDNLIHACSRVNAHLIQLSTDFIFSGDKGPLDEEAIPAPVNFYGKSKVAAEELIQKSNIKWAILRTVLVYGVTADMSRSNLVLWVKENLEKGKTIRVVNDQWRTPTLAEDLAMGCYLAAKKKATGIFNISGKDFVTPFDIAIKVADYFKLDRKLILPTDASQFKQTARRPSRTGFIIEKAKRELGYSPHSLDEGIAIVAGQIENITSPTSTL